MKAIYSQLMMLAMAGSFIEQDYYNKPAINKLSFEEIQQLQIRASINRKHRLLKRGNKEFTIDGITVIALNNKNAIRKVNNIKKQLEL